MGGESAEEANKSPLTKLLDFAAKADDIILVADKMDLLLNSFDRLADMEDNLDSVADTLSTVGWAINRFAGDLGSLAGLETGWGGLMSKFRGEEEKESPLDALMDFIDSLASIGDVGPNVESLVTSLGLLGSMATTLLPLAETLRVLGQAFWSLGAGLNKIAGGGEEKSFLGGIWDSVFGGDETNEKE